MPKIFFERFQIDSWALNGDSGGDTGSADIVTYEWRSGLGTSLLLCCEVDADGEKGGVRSASD